MTENTSLRERLLKAADESWARADAQCEPGEVLWKAPLVDLLREAAAALSTPPAEGDDTKRLNWLDAMGSSYGFEDMHEGNRWLIEGPYPSVRSAIDAAMIAATEGE